MRWFSATVAFALAVFPNVATAQDAGVSLSTVAARDGYRLQWLLPDRAAALYRPGVVIVLRPGSLLYDVNDRVEASDVAPRYVNGDVIVSQHFVTRLRELALARVPARNEQPSAESSVASNFRGALSVQMQPLHGDEAVTVSGQAPAGAPVTLTMLATISSDIPTIVVSRADVQPDVNGHFSARVPIASDYYPGSTLRVLATSAPGVTPATAEVTVGPPNADLTLPADQWPPR